MPRKRLFKISQKYICLSLLQLRTDRLLCTTGTSKKTNKQKERKKNKNKKSRPVDSRYKMEEHPPLVDTDETPTQTLTVTLTKMFKCKN